MEAKEYTLQDILTENKKYYIPAYQRPYSWEKDNAYQLINDIMESYEAQEKEYFVGSMICIKKENNTFEVVDGQQRLITLSLVLAQLKNLIERSGVRDDLQKRILPIDPYTEESEPRLLVRNNECNVYTSYILQGDERYKPEKPTYTESLFLDNYLLLGEYLKEYNQNTLCNLTKYLLHNVFVVFVQTADFASSFRLFNVLNNRGLPLNNADLIKNSLFEAARNHSGSSKRLEDIWSEIEELVGIDKLDKFLTLHKLSEKKDRDRVVQRDYDSFIETLEEDFKNNAAEMALVLLHSAKNYQRVKENNFLDPIVRRKISFLLLLTPDEWMPPFMAFLNRVTHGRDLSWEQFSEFVNIFEKVYMQGWIKKLLKSKREMVCYSALVAINNHLPFNEIIAHISEHADNQGMLESLNKNIYEPTPNIVKMVKVLLLRLDRESQDDSVDKTYNGRITIEHILPQKIRNDYWRQYFTEDQHNYWLHKLGNLTLISGSKNSEAQTSDFERKKAIYAKQNQRVSFDLTKELNDYENWTPQSIQERHTKLIEMIRCLWVL